jgi:general secretion pathway protein G
MRRGFTLLELLLVMAILSIIMTIASVSFGTIRNRSEDSRRKTDVEEIRSALEQYKSINNKYPTPNITITMGLPFGQGFTDTNHTYMSKMPQDPDFPAKTYYYESTDGSDYVLRSQLNNPEPTPCNLTPTPDLCGSTHNCNYCYSSYGQL